jgi:hypothetical protein
MDDELEFMASSVEISIGDRRWNASMTCLSKNIRQDAGLYADSSCPRFPSDRVELARKMSSRHCAGKTTIERVADQELNGDLPRQSAGRHPTIDSVSAITGRISLNFTSTIVLTISSRPVKRLSGRNTGKAEPTFAGWKRGTGVLSSGAGAGQDSGRRIPGKKDVNQSVIRDGSTRRR